MSKPGRDGWEGSARCLYRPHPARASKFKVLEQRFCGGGVGEVLVVGAVASILTADRCSVEHRLHFQVDLAAGALDRKVAGGDEEGVNHLADLAR